MYSSMVGFLLWTSARAGLGGGTTTFGGKGDLMCCWGNWRICTVHVQLIYLPEVRKLFSLGLSLLDSRGDRFFSFLGVALSESMERWRSSSKFQRVTSSCVSSSLLSSLRGNTVTASVVVMW